MAYIQCYHYDGFMTWIAYFPSDIHNVGVNCDTMACTETSVQPLETLSPHDIASPPKAASMVLNIHVYLDRTPQIHCLAYDWNEAEYLVVL